MPALQKIGILAGGGHVPHMLAQRLAEQGVEVFVVALVDGLTVPHERFRVGQAGKIIKRFRVQGITDLVLIGSIDRPDWKQMMPDWKALEFVRKYGLSAGGDDDLLRKLRLFLEAEGFTLHGVHHFLPELLMPAGVLTQLEPDMADVEFGFVESQRLGAADIGQAVVVRDGDVLAEEDARGTNAMLAADIEMRGGVLVKSCKPQQDMDLDLPTAGLRTIELAHQAGLSGVVLHAGRSLLMDRDAVIAYADVHGMFIIGVE